MTILDDDDHRRRHRMGRLQGLPAEDVRVARILTRWRLSSSRHPLVVARRVLGDRSAGVRPQAVSRVIGNRKSFSGVRQLVRYVGRAAEEAAERPALRDEEGRVLDLDQALKVIESWQAEEGPDASPGSALREQNRRPNARAWHIVWSVAVEPGEDPEGVAAALRRAAQVTVDAVFTASGHAVLWVLHRDTPAHPHVHLVVRSRSSDGRRLWFDRGGEIVETMRGELAQALTVAGVSREATRRDERPALREAIAAGEERLRPRARRDGGHGRVAQVHVAAPEWWTNHQDRWQHPEASDRVLLAQVVRDAVTGLSDVEADLMPLFAEVYQRPRQALRRWLALALPDDPDPADERPRLACWLAARAPEIFGRTRLEPPADWRQRVNDLVPDETPAMQPPVRAIALLRPTQCQAEADRETLVRRTLHLATRLEQDPSLEGAGADELAERLRQAAARLAALPRSAARPMPPRHPPPRFWLLPPDSSSKPAATPVPPDDPPADRQAVAVAVPKWRRKRKRGLEL